MCVYKNRDARIQIETHGQKKETHGQKKRRTDKKKRRTAVRLYGKNVAGNYSPIIIMPEAWLPLGVSIVSNWNLIGTVRDTATF